MKLKPDDKMDHNIQGGTYRTTPLYVIKFKHIFQNTNHIDDPELVFLELLVGKGPLCLQGMQL